jgi:hypothetical protein
VQTAGDPDIAASNIKDQVNIFGITGNQVNPDPWDLRVGKTVNSVTGKLKVNCRNRVRSAVFNYDGAIGSIGQAGVTSGSAIDIWDTIEDYNAGTAGLPGSIVTAWGNNTDCGGVETEDGDDNVWKDVTTTNGTTASTCAAKASNCTMQDKITGLWWSKLQPMVSWNAAWNTCNSTLNTTTYPGNISVGYNGQTGWRLPTQKELLEAYTHGIRSAARTNWIPETNMFHWYWSGSNWSWDTTQAAKVGPAVGDSNFDIKSSTTLRVVCVR